MRHQACRQTSHTNDLQRCSDHTASQKHDLAAHFSFADSQSLRSSSHCLRNDGTTSIKQSAVCFRCKLSTFPCRLYQHQNRAYRLSVTAPLDSAPILKAFLPIHKPVLRGGYRLPRKSSRVSDSCTNPQRRLSSMPARVVDIAIIGSKVQVSGKAHVHLPSQSSRLQFGKNTSW